MDLRATLLGLLSWKPASGYDLKRIVSESEVYFWSGNNNQIYKSLIELQREGLVTCQVQLQESLPAKKVYSVTAAGLDELRRSLLAAPQLPEVHNSFLIQLAWAQALPAAGVCDLLEQYTAEVAARLQMLQALATRSDGCPHRSERETYLWRQVMANLVGACEAELAWASRTRDEFQARFLPEG